jgi:hypothetical protein
MRTLFGAGVIVRGDDQDGFVPILIAALHTVPPLPAKSARWSHRAQTNTSVLWFPSNLNRRLTWVMILTSWLPGIA